MDRAAKLCKSLTISWVKAHIGHPGNENADRLAKLGAADEENIAYDVPNVSGNFLRSSLRTKVVEHWNEWWKSRLEYRQTKHFFPEIDQKLAKSLVKFKRKSFSIMVQLITGHNFLRRHSSIVLNGYPCEDSGCRHCDQDEESSFHIFARCEKFAEPRRKWFDEPFLDHPFKINAKNLMGFLRDAKIDDLSNID